MRYLVFALLGALAGFVVGLTTTSLSCEDDFFFSKADCIKIFTGGLTVLGGLLGLHIGDDPTEKWAPVDITQLKAQPAGGTPQSYRNP